MRNEDGKERSKILCHCHKCPPACPRHHYESTSSEPSTTTAANKNQLNQSTVLLVLWAPQNKTQQTQQYKTKNKTVQYYYYNYCIAFLFLRFRNTRIAIVGDVVRRGIGEELGGDGGGSVGT